MTGDNGAYFSSTESEVDIPTGTELGNIFSQYKIIERDVYS